MIHTTIGLYASGDYKVNGVTTENLRLHIEYNKEARGGRALFLDGFCIYEGTGVSEKQIDDMELKAKSLKQTKDTAPYV